MLRPATRQRGLRARPYVSRRELYLGPTRGVVVRVIASDEDNGTGHPPQVVCDVLLTGGGIVRAPVLQRGSSVSNVSRWIPTPSTTNVTTGAPVKIVNDALDPPASDPEDLDGEIVLVDWIDRSVDRPVIIGSLEHTRARRSVLGPTAYPGTKPDGMAPIRRHSTTSERYLAHQGTVAKVDGAGNVVLDLRQAGQANDGASWGGGFSPAVGNVDVALRTGKELVVRGQGGAPVLRIVATAGGGASETLVLAAALVAHLEGWQKSIEGIVAAIQAANVEGKPLVFAEPLPSLPDRASRVTLGAATVKIDPTPEG